ncbi:MAG: hypothetical protein II161_07965 [Erysipelotrichaceae bacterium]|nr:hypothetical protein [Erysipelotrichaceae bacterium]
MKKSKSNLKVIIGLLLLAGAVALAILALRFGRYDYSQAVELKKAKAGQPAFCRFKTMEQPFAHDEKLQYYLVYEGGDTYLIALSPEALEKLKQQEYKFLPGNILTIFNQEQTLYGYCRPIQEELAAILQSEYELSGEDYQAVIGDNLLAVNQPAGNERQIWLAGGSVGCLLAAIALLAFGRKGKEKKPEEVCNKSVYLVE